MLPSATGGTQGRRARDLAVSGASRDRVQYTAFGRRFTRKYLGNQSRSGY